jgi:hypothetical protein
MPDFDDIKKMADQHDKQTGSGDSTGNDQQ